MFGDSVQAAITRQLCWLAFTLTAVSISLDTLSTALFLRQEGARGLPFIYLLLSITMIPISFGVGRLLDRWSVSKLTEGLLTTASAALVGAWLAISGKSASGVYCALMVAHIYGLLLLIFFWVLVAEFLTVTETKHATFWLTIMLSLGGMAGGVLGGLLSKFPGPLDGLIVIAVIGLFVAFQVRLATVSMSRIAPGAGTRTEEVQNAISFFTLLRRYPIVRVLIAFTATFGVIYCFTEYVVFDIYAKRYPDGSDLAMFLATLFSVMQVLELAVILAASNFILHYLGARLRNIIYPAMTMAAVGGVAAFPGIGTAVAAHANYQPLYNSVLVTVNAVNYASLPPDHVGRARLLSTGIAFPLSIATGGLVLLYLRDSLEVSLVAWFAFGLSLAYAVFGFWIGKLYLPGLLANLRTGNLELDTLKALPRELESQIESLLTTTDRETRHLGIELFKLADRSGTFRLLSKTDFAALTEREIRDLALCAMNVLRVPAIKALLARAASEEKLHYFQQALALASSHQLRVSGPETSLRRLYQAVLADETESIKNCISANPDVGEIVTAQSSDTLRGALVECVTLDESLYRRLASTLCKIATSNTALYDLSIRQLDSSDSREAALEVLAAAGLKEGDSHKVFALLREALPREERRVLACLPREQLATRLAALLHELIESGRSQDHAKALRLQKAATMSEQFGYLRAIISHYQHHLLFVNGLDTHSERHSLCVAEFRARAVAILLRCIGASGQTDAATTIGRRLRSIDRHTRANALEALASLSGTDIVRGAAELIIEIESGKRGKGIATADSVTDYWLRACIGSLNTEEVDMDHIIFLKRVSLFRELDFDTLLAIDNALSHRTCRAGDTIFRTGDTGGDMFIVQRGQIQLESTTTPLALVQSGEFFGEMALLDASPRSATATCVTDATLLRLDQRSFEELVEYFPTVLRALAILFAERIRTSNETIRNGDSTASRPA